MTENTQKPTKNRTWIYIALFALAALATVVVIAVLMNIKGKKEEATQYPLTVVEIAENELDPAVWGLNFPVK